MPRSATALRAAFLAGAAVLAFSSSVRAIVPGTPDSPITGVRGEPAVRAVVRWSEMARQSTQPHAARSAKRTRRPPPRAGRDLPVPEGALLRMESSAAPAESPEISLPPSPAPAASFEALPDDHTAEPPDTHGAVGPNHLMVTLNSQVRIQDRAGTALSTVSQSAFWATVAGVDPFDPRVVYDPYADRWITIALGSFFRSLLVGVSRSGDPTGSWNLFRINADGADRIDFPVVGFNKNWIIVASSWLTVEGGTWTWRGSQYRVFDRADLYGGGRGSFTLIAAVGGGPEPAVMLDPEISTLYLMQVWNGNADGNGVLRLYTITGAIGSEVLTPVTFVVTPDPWSNQPPSGDLALCPQMGNPARIPCFGGSQPVFRNGTIWAAHIIYLPADAPTRSAIQWWQLAPDGDVLQRGRLDDPSGVLFYGFPSLAVNANNDMLLGFASFSAQQFASCSYAYRAAADPSGTLRTERVLKAGEDIYLGHPDGHGIRWGDYSASAVDPSDDTGLWTIQEYAATRDPATGASRWGTWWGRVIPEAAPVDRPPPEAPARVRTPRALPPRRP